VTAPQEHRCGDHVDWIGGWPPYECCICGKRLSADDLVENPPTEREQ
jgi:hypothetical protein